MDRLTRLDLLASRLKADEQLTVGDLAEEFGVGRRTLSRDIEILRERGLPVEADRGRGGGIRLHRHWGVGRLQLSYREAIDLLVSIAIAEQLRSPWLLANLSAIRHKLAASFSPELKSRIATVRRRILIGQNASPAVLETLAPPRGEHVGALFAAFVEARVLTIRYRGGTGRRTTRTIEPQLLLLNYPVWYVVAWDRGRDAVRSFRFDRIGAATPKEDHFALRPAAVFDEAIAGIDAITP